MVGRTTPPTAEEKRRMELIGEQIFGCIPCLLEDLPFRAATVQHVVEGGKRLGHQATYGLCPWHHFATKPDPGMSKTTILKVFGPSLANGSKPYRERYGSEAMLVEVQDFMIDLWLQHPWFPADLPQAARDHTRAYWRQLFNAVN